MIKQGDLLDYGKNSYEVLENPYFVDSDDEKRIYKAKVRLYDLDYLVTWHLPAFRKAKDPTHQDSGYIVYFDLIDNVF